nr:MAG TPA: hypothetical protein [Caudoviricetes sp.]
MLKLNYWQLLKRVRLRTIRSHALQPVRSVASYLSKTVEVDLL